MRIVIAAVGRMRRTAEADLVSRYLERARKTGSGIALTDFSVIELDEARARNAEARKSDEAARLRSALPDGARVIALDESGKPLTSREFSDLLERWRDDGCSAVGLVLGGPDGHGTGLLSRADAKMSLGRMTLPHLLARAVLAEQLYRTTTILSGHPYHRD